MSCYTRHLSDILKSVGIKNTKENRKVLDKKIREIMGKEKADCPDVWREVKVWIHNPKK